MKEKLEKIKVLALDVDGVLTDGRIIVDDTGKELKNFNVKDGFGLVLLMKKGLKTVGNFRKIPANYDRRISRH